MELIVVKESLLIIEREFYWKNSWYGKEDVSMFDKMIKGICPNRINNLNKTKEEEEGWT